MDTISVVRNLAFDERLAGHALLEAGRLEAIRLLEALAWKSRLSEDFPLTVCLLGGTGTGKSTLFNSLAGKPISDVGTRRPCTLDPVVLVHEDSTAQIADCPYFRTQGESTAVIVSHHEADTAHLVLIDTPDFDSVEASNRLICENVFIISDVLVFVTSQEKYADLAGREMLEKARQWRKTTFFVMNKTRSDVAYDDFAATVHERGHSVHPIKVERMEGAAAYIPGLRDRPEFVELLSVGKRKAERERIRTRNTDVLNSRTIARIEDLENPMEEHAERINAVNMEIQRILAFLSGEMEGRLDMILTKQSEEHVRERLQGLLRKYDILFVPRMIVRNALQKVFQSVSEILWTGLGNLSAQTDEKSIRMEDLHQTRSAARLEPLETAVAKLNLQIAELLATDSNLDDLREIARQSVPRWDKETIRLLYEEAFPGVEHLLEGEFERFRHGLSRMDEIKLYGSYTAWALFLVTAEIILGGGFTLLDALLNTVIVPFIPKWMLNLKVVDMLREIGERIDQEHRKALKSILKRQAELYTAEFAGLLPPHEALDELRRVRSHLVDQQILVSHDA